MSRAEKPSPPPNPTLYVGGAMTGQSVISRAIELKALSLCFYDLDMVDIADESMSANPCPNCDGEGECVGFSSNDPDDEGQFDDCEKCDGTGSASCPSCDSPAPLLVRGDGRCVGCVSEAALEQAEGVAL